VNNKKSQHKILFVISSILFLTSAFIPPQANSVVGETFPALIGNPVYRWGLPVFFAFTTLYYFNKIRLKR